MDSHCYVARWRNGQSKPGLNSFEFTRKVKLLMIQHFGSDQVSLSEVIAVSMRSQYYTLIEQSLMTLSEQNAIRFSEKKITVITVQCSRGAIKMPCFNTALTILYYGLLVGISLEFPHAMVWLVWHFCSEKADFFFSEKKTTFRRKQHFQRWWPRPKESWCEFQFLSSHFRFSVWFLLCKFSCYLRVILK